MIMKFEFLNDVVRKKIVLSNNKSESSPMKNLNAMNIAYGVDDNFVMPMGVSMISILENNKTETIVFHVLAETLNDKNIESLQNISNTYSTEIYLYFIDGRVFETLPTTEHFTKATYNRFLLTKVLKGTVERVIYIDADILCMGSMAELKDLEFGNKIVAVVEDIGAVADRQIKQLQLTQKQYFNAGFLYINIDAWEMAAISEKAVQYSFEHIGELNWLDQDALNVILENSCIFLSKRYDYIFDLGYKKFAHVMSLPEDTVLVHYAGRYKPWHMWCMHPLKRDFEKYRKLSCWADAQIGKPQNYKDMKKMGRSFFIYGEFRRAFIWYAKYAYHKMRTTFYQK